MKKHRFQLDPKKLKAAREAAGLTVQQLADAAMPHPSAATRKMTAAKILSGANPNPSLSAALRLAAALGRSVDELV